VAEPFGDRAVPRLFVGWPKRPAAAREARAAFRGFWRAGILKGTKLLIGKGPEFRNFFRMSLDGKEQLIGFADRCERTPPPADPIRSAKALRRFAQCHFVLRYPAFADLSCDGKFKI
jgi:hypothetical protein